MRFWRCYNPNCSDRGGIPGHDFTADVPVCDKCNVDGRNPRFASLISPVVVIHFDPPSAVPGYGEGHLACNPTQGIRGHMATGDPDAVNCPACRKTPVWENASKGKAVDPRYDLPIEIDLAAQVIRRADEAN
jgi:hypothetical protein